MKSMCHDARRNSPSVADCRPTSSCIFTTSAMARSSIARRSSAVMRPEVASSRAWRTSGGRSRLPTWSARNGGVVRSGMSQLLSRPLRWPPPGLELGDQRVDVRLLLCDAVGHHELGDQLDRVLVQVRLPQRQHHLLEYVRRDLRVLGDGLTGLISVFGRVLERAVHRPDEPLDHVGVGLEELRRREVRRDGHLGLGRHPVVDDHAVPRALPVVMNGSTRPAASTCPASSCPTMSGSGTSTKLSVDVSTPSPSSAALTVSSLMLRSVLMAMVLPSRSAGSWMSLSAGTAMAAVSLSGSSVAWMPCEITCTGRPSIWPMSSDTMFEKPISWSPFTTAGMIAAPPWAIAGWTSRPSSSKKPCWMPR